MSSTDHEIGRVIDHLEESEQLDNTVIVVVSDNGASGEGGPNHSFNENKSSTTLHYVYNWLGERIQTVSSPDPIPVGTHVLTAEFQMTGDQSETDSAVGTLTLYVDTEAVADGPSTTQPGAFSSTGDGLCVGRDSGSAVAGYPVPFAFVGGTIDRVVVDVSGDHYVDREKQVLAAYIARD